MNSISVTLCCRANRLSSDEWAAFADDATTFASSSIAISNIILTTSKTLPNTDAFKGILSLSEFLPHAVACQPQTMSVLGDFAN